MPLVGYLFLFVICFFSMPYLSIAATYDSATNTVTLSEVKPPLAQGAGNTTSEAVGDLTGQISGAVQSVAQEATVLAGQVGEVAQQGRDMLNANVVVPGLNSGQPIGTVGSLSQMAQQNPQDLASAAGDWLTGGQFSSILGGISRTLDQLNDAYGQASRAISTVGGTLGSTNSPTLEDDSRNVIRPYQAQEGYSGDPEKAAREALAEIRKINTSNFLSNDPNTNKNIRENLSENMSLKEAEWSAGIDNAISGAIYQQAAVYASLQKDMATIGEIVQNSNDENSLMAVSQYTNQLLGLLSLQIDKLIRLRAYRDKADLVQAKVDNSTRQLDQINTMLLTGHSKFSKE